MSGTSTALAILDGEIKRRAHELDGLKLARELLARGGAAVAEAPLRITHQKTRAYKKPKPTRRTAAAADETQTYEVNGQKIACSEQQFATMELLNSLADGEWCKGSNVRAIFDNSKDATRKALRGLNEKLAPAAALIAVRKGYFGGYRLEAVE
jgi:hypothetical protein